MWRSEIVRACVKNELTAANEVDIGTAAVSLTQRQVSFLRNENIFRRQSVCRSRCQQYSRVCMYVYARNRAPVYI